MSSSLLPTVAAQLATLSAVEHHVSAASKATITKRLQELTPTAPVTQPVVANKSSQHPALVMRPGIPPRPLDPFFFEVDHERS